MFRRPRFSVRPKVGTPVKTPQEAPPATPEASETPKEDGESAAAVTDSQSAVTPPEKATAAGDGSEQNADGAGSSAAVQRRKRFSVKPKVAPGRPSTAARMQKSPVKAVSETPVEVPVPDLDEPTTSSVTGTAAAPQRLQSPRRRGSSEDSRQPKGQPKATLLPSGESGTTVPADSGKELESKSKGVKGAAARLPDKAPFSLPDKEAIELSEKARTLVSSKGRLSISPPAFSLSRLLNDPSDLQRIAKAQKLRDLLRQEMQKEKKLKKGNTRVQEYTLDPAKMTMRDLIRYLPQSNPMTSSLEEPAPENEIVLPPSPSSEASPEKVKEPPVLPKIGSPREVEEEEGAMAGEDEEEEDDSSIVPRVKVAEDGTLIIDEESLTVEVLRAKGPNPAQERDAIFERGSTTTYSSFRKGTYTKPWSSEETDMFFLAISMVGTDFSMICQLFPQRNRSEIKNKFKKEERENSWRVDKAFRERRKLDIEYFTKLLEKILEVHNNRKKLKSLAAKNSPRKTQRKATGKAAARKLAVVQEDDKEEEKEMSDLEEEREKENEDLGNEGAADAAKPVKKRKRKNREEALTEGPDDKRNKAGEKSNDQDEASIPGDAEAALPEDCPTSDTSEKTESVNEAPKAKIKPAKLSRAPKPLLPLGRKWAKKPPPAPTKTCSTASDKEDESAVLEDAEDQVDKDASPSSQADGKKSGTDDSEEEDAIVRPPRPTRSGRVPKPIQLLNYRSKEAPVGASSASPEGSAARPKAKCTAKRGRPAKPQSSHESKKPKLLTLRASQSEYSDEEDERQRGEEEEEEEERPLWGSSEDSAAPVFVPASLRSPRPVIPEVEETMEELDILANISDVLGEGTAEPCDHQLDLLVDVIDFLSSDPIEVSESESYNEAAQTLLTISNMAHLPPSAQTQVATPDLTAGTTLVKETSQHVEEEIAAMPAVLEETSAVPSDHGASEAVPDVEPLTSTTDNDDIIVTESIDQRTDFEMDPPLRSPKSSKTNSPRTSKGRSCKVKPKPNLGQASRSAQSQLPPGTSTVGRAEKIQPEAPDLAQITETLSAAEETPRIPDRSENLLKEDIYYTEELSGSQKSTGEVQSATSDQIASEKQRRCFSEAGLEPGVELASGDSRSTEVLTAGRSCIDQVTSDTAVIESQGSDMDSAPAQESGDHLAPCVAPVEESPVNQKGEREVESAQPTRKSRFQKVKPKLNLAQTSRTIRSKPQTSKDNVEKDSHPTPNPTIHENTLAEVEAEPTCTKSPKISRCCPDIASDLIPLVNLATTPTPTEDLSTTEEVKTDAGVVGRVESEAATSHQGASEEQNIPEEQLTARREEAPRHVAPTLESVDEKLTSHCGAAESCHDSRLTSNSVVTESQTGPTSNVDSVQEVADHPATNAEELPVGQKEGEDAASAFRSPRRRLQKVKPKPNLPQTSRTARSKPRTSKDSVAPLQHAETPSSQASGSKSTEDARAVAEAPPTCSAPPPERTIQISTSTSSTSTIDASVSEPPSELYSTHKTTEEASSCEAPKTDVGLDSNSQGSELNVRQRRQRFSKVKPNLGSSPRTARGKLLANAISKPPEPDHVDTSLSSETQPARTQRDLTVMDMTSTLESTRTEPSTSTKPVPAESEAAQDGTQPEGSSPPCLTIATYWGAENWSQYTDLVLENMSGENLPVKEGESLGANTANSDHMEAGPASQGGCDRDMSVRASDVQPSEGGSAKSEAESILITSTRSTAGSKESTRQPPAECEAQSPDAVQQCSDTDPTAAQSSDGNPSEPTNSPSRKAPQARRGRLVKPKPRLVPSSRPPQPRQIQNTKQAETDVGVDAELQPDIPDPTEGAVVQSRSQSASPSEAESSLSCVTQVPDSFPRAASPSNAGGTQILPIFPDTLSQQEPSDSDETFFILSLTEIPVGSLSDSVDGVPDPPARLPVTGASIEQHSVPVPASVEESGEAAACPTQPGRIVEDPVEPPAESSTVHPSKLPETPEKTDETEAAGGPPRPRRRVKAQAKPKTTKRKQPSKKEAGSAPIPTHSELPGSSLQAEASVAATEPRAGGGDPEDVQQETLTGGSKGAQATRARPTRSQMRKPKGPAVRAARAAGERSSAPAASPTPPPAPAELSASQENDSVEEEPTSVSQYFLCDIFTEVEG